MPSDVVSGPDPQQLAPAVQKLLSPAAPLPLRMMAARGIIPGAKPHEIVIAVAALADAEEEKLRELARTTLGKLPPPILNGALAADLPENVTDKLCFAYSNVHEVVERLLRMPRLSASGLEQLATTADERSGELIATNEQLMLRHPRVIEKLYMNKNVRMSTADRLIELSVRNGIELAIPAFKEAAAAIHNELIPEPAEERSYDDVLFEEADLLAQRAAQRLKDGEDTHEVDEEGDERVKEDFRPLSVKIAEMTISQKVRTATLGSSAARLILIRDSNRLVAAAAAKSPLLRENEAAQISASRAVSEDVLRLIAMNRDFTRSYQIKLNLVTNPRTPLTFASRLLPHLRESDLRILSKSKNVSGAVATAVRQQIERKKPGGKK